MTIITSRRTFLHGLVATPAVVAISSLMPVRSIARLAPRVLELFVDPSAEVPLFPMFNLVQDAVDYANEKMRLFSDDQVRINLRNGVHLAHHAALLSDQMGLVVSNATHAVLDMEVQFVCSADRKIPCMEATKMSTLTFKRDTAFIGKDET